MPKSTLVNEIKIYLFTMVALLIEYSLTATRLLKRYQLTSLSMTYSNHVLIVVVAL